MLGSLYTTELHDFALQLRFISIYQGELPLQRRNHLFLIDHLLPRARRRITVEFLLLAFYLCLFYCVVDFLVQDESVFLILAFPFSRTHVRKGR